MKVKDLMTRNVVTCTPDAPLSDAARWMWDYDCGFVPVVNPSTDSVVGVVTDRDLCMASYTQGLPLRNIPISRVLNGTVYCCDPEDEVEKAMQVMREHQVRRLPVVQGSSKRLEGVLSLNDLARYAVRKQLQNAQAFQRDVAVTLGFVCQARSLGAAG